MTSRMNRTNILPRQKTLVVVVVGGGLLSLGKHYDGKITEGIKEMEPLNTGQRPAKAQLKSRTTHLRRPMLEIPGALMPQSDKHWSAGTPASPRCF